eukprot:jgi/Mesvir1/5234/Mv15358-RA.1
MVVNGCPTGWTPVIDSGCLQMSAYNVPAAHASITCPVSWPSEFPNFSNTGHLVKITSSAANAAINSIVCTDESCVIGLNDLVTEGVYVWHDGTPPITFTNWAVAEPDAVFTAKTFASILFDGTWLMTWDDYESPAVCQINLLCGKDTNCPASKPACVDETCVECRNNAGCTGGKICESNACIVDVNPPQITCPGNITAQTSEPTDGRVATFAVSAIDGEDNSTLALECVASLPGGDETVQGPGSLTAVFGFPTGTTSVSCTATDGNSNSDTCSFSVIVDCAPGACPVNKFCTRWGCVDCLVDNDCATGLFCRGYMCIDCVSNQTGIGATVGCTNASLPYCVAPPSDFVVHTGAGDAGFCVACLETEGADLGCDSQQPLCVTTHTFESVDTDGEGEGGFVVVAAGATAECFACRDDQVGYAPDLGCTDNKPYCVFGRNEEGYAKGCSEFPNVACEFEGPDAVLETNDATCATDLAIEARIELVMANCTVLRLNFTRLAASMASVLNVSLCAIQLDLVSGSSSASSPRRHLQQQQAEPLPNGRVTLLLVAFLTSEQQGNDIIGHLNTTIEMATLLAILDANVGDVISISITAATILRLSSVTSDPHFVTPRGQKFDFNGIAGRTYCIVMDKHLQVNARFAGMASESIRPSTATIDKASMAAVGPTDGQTDGKTIDQTDSPIRHVQLNGETPGRPDDRTWMDQVGILHGSDTVLVDAASPPGTPYTASFGTVHVNGKPLLGRAARTTLPSGLTVARKKTRVLIVIPGIVVIEVETVRASFWELGSGPGRNFLNLHVKEFNSTSAAHGILGQAFAHKSGVAQIEGNPQDYATSGIFTTDCFYRHFDD